jgi:alpha-beta hydrolase superfamily lysophospholipase
VQRTSLYSRGLRLNLEVFAAGDDDPVVLFLPGTGKYARFYRQFLERLRSAGFNVLGLDPQGHGRSEGRRGDFTMEELVQNARDALTFARHELGPRLGLLGTSQGALVALYTLAADERVMSAACHNAALLDEAGSKQVNVSRFSKLVRPYVGVAARYAPYLRVPIRRYLPLQTIYDDVNLGRVLEQDPMLVPAYTLRSYASLATARPARPIEQVTTPTLFLTGEGDRLFPPGYVRTIYDRLTCRKELALIPGAGHMLFVEYVDQSLPLVADWFKRTLQRDA